VRGAWSRAVSYAEVEVVSEPPRWPEKQPNAVSGWLDNKGDFHEYCGGRVEVVSEQQAVSSADVEVLSEAEAYYYNADVEVWSEAEAYYYYADVEELSEADAYYYYYADEEVGSEAEAYYYYADVEVVSDAEAYYYYAEEVASEAEAYYYY